MASRRIRNGSWLAMAGLAIAACGVHTSQSSAIQISSISPNSGSMTGGLTVTLSGAGFDDGTHTAKVSFGINQAIVQSLNATTATVILPAGLSCGGVDVRLQNAFGNATSLNGFSYSGGSGSLSITSMVPSTGGIAGGTAVTIKGAGFTGGVGLTLAGVPLQNIQVVDDATITAVTPPTQAGGVSDLSARNCNTQASLPGAFIYQSGMTGGVVQMILTRYPNPGQFAAPTPADIADPYAEFVQPTNNQITNPPPALGTCSFNPQNPPPVTFTDINAGNTVTLVSGGTTVTIPQMTLTTN